jgi:hypothetical protein
MNELEEESVLMLLLSSEERRSKAREKTYREVHSRVRDLMKSRKNEEQHKGEENRIKG